MNYRDAISSLTSDRDAVKPITWGGYVARFDTADAFSASTSYKGGSLVTKDSKIYSRVAVATSTAGAWSASDWTEVCDVIPDFDDEETYAVGDQVRHNGYVYEAIEAISTAGSFDSSKWTRISDPTHILSFVERNAESPSDNVSQYNMLVTVNLTNGTTYGSFINDLKIDSILFQAQAIDTSWTSGTITDFENARSSSNRW